MDFKKAASVGLEISQGYISAVELEFKDKAAFLKKSGKIELPPLLVTPSFREENISDAEKFKAAIKNLFDNAGINCKQISVALPDASVKISFLEFEDIPKEREKIIELIKWNLKKALPFSSHEAIVDFQVLDTPSGESRSYRLIATLIKKDVLEQYENLLSGCHLIPDVIIPSSFALYNLYHDRVLEIPLCAIVALSKKKIIVIVAKHGKPCFHRSKELDSERDALREILTSLNYYQDIDGEVPARIYLVDNGLEAVQLKADIEMYFGGIEIQPVGLPDVINPHTKDFGVGVKGGNGSMNVFSGAAGAALINSEQ